MKRLFVTSVWVWMIACATVVFGQPAAPAQPEVIFATTTSVQDTGLLDLIVPMFEKDTDYHVKAVAVGTGQALAMAGRGEADIILAHAPDAEKTHDQAHRIVEEAQLFIEATYACHDSLRERQAAGVFPAPVHTGKAAGKP